VTNQDKPRTRLQCEPLELRENPSTLFSDSFDSSSPPRLSPGWQTSGTGSFNTTRIISADGTNALASNGNNSTQSRLTHEQLQPVDAGVSVQVYSNTPTPVVLFARGQNLNSTNASYVGVQVRAGATQIDLVEMRGGQTTVLTTLRISAAVNSQWLLVKLQPTGTRLTASIQRQDTRQFLTAQGTWQTNATDALQATIPSATGTGAVGIARLPGGSGSVFVDDFDVTSPIPSTQTITQNFDSIRVGNRPADWSQWVSDGSAGFVTSNQRAESAPNAITNSGGTNTTSRTWLNSSQPADVQASASLYADSLIPATLFVRGQNMNSATPTFYGLTVTRGVEVRITATFNGQQSTLAKINSKEYVSGVWLRISLVASGTTLRAVVSRADTNQWLNQDGVWESYPQPALEVQDSSLRNGGFVGLQRHARTAGNITFDNIEIRTGGSTTGPALGVTTSQNTNSVRGDVTFQVTDASNSARRVEYRLNGKLRATANSAPHSWTLDSTTLPNAAHELVIRAFDHLGNPSTQTIRFTTTNTNPATPVYRPELPRKQSHIRIAQLAYSGNPMSSFEQQRLAQSVDLVIPNTRFLNTIETASPSTSQVIYSNISNLYLDLLQDWLSYADTNRLDRESAFYHVSEATPFSGSSPSSQPVTWLWGVYRQTGTSPPTDLTSNSRGGRTTQTEFGGAGTSLSIGTLDKFSELNFDLSRNAASGWSGIIEYVSAVNASGQPTQWKTLNLKTDTTNRLTRSGQWQFDPPADWVPSNNGGSERNYYIRMRSTSGTTAQSPVARTILGRDYVNARGSNAGTIPAFDYAADRDRDGYLNDAEYANRASGKNARFAYESRLFYPYYGQMRFVSNPSSVGFSRWASAYHTDLLRSQPLADGVFLDNSNGRLPFGTTRVVEGTTTYGTDYAEVVAAIGRTIGSKLVISNTAGGNADATPVTEESSGVFEEFLLRPTEVSWSGFNDVANLVSSRVSADSPSPYVILDSHPGTFRVTDERVRMGTLSYYYLLADPNKTMLMFFGGYSPSASWQETWIPAATTNVGQPRGEMRQFASGEDPENTRLSYRIYSRDYQNALVLYKPRSYTAGVGTGTTNDSTSTTHTLNGNYRRLNADGSLGPVINRVTLRNGEGVVLMKA
jgi:Bacterial Ig domain